MNGAACLGQLILATRGKNQACFKRKTISLNVDLALRFEPSAIQWSIWFNELMKTILSFITLVMH